MTQDPKDAPLQQAVKEAWSDGFDAAIQSLEELADEATITPLKFYLRKATALLRETKP